MFARMRGAAVEIPAYRRFGPNLRATSRGTVTGGQFDWGGRLRKGNGGAQRLAQTEWKPVVECKGKSQLDCETDTSSRDESRA